MTLPSNLPAVFADAAAAYTRALREIAQSRIAAAQPEDQLKTPVQQLLRGVTEQAATGRGRFIAEPACGAQRGHSKGKTQ